MTIIRISLIAAAGLLAVGLSAPASATERGSSTVLDLAKDRGSWIAPKSKSQRGYGYDYRHGYDRYDDHHHRKHYKKKKRRKAFKRGYRRGYDRGYDEGYYEARRRAYHERRHRRHHHYPRYGFRGGIYFGDGHYGRGDFRFRY